MHVEKIYTINFYNFAAFLNKTLGITEKNKTVCVWKISSDLTAISREKNNRNLNVNLKKKPKKQNINAFI